MKILLQKKGQSLVEYMIIVALMAVSTMGIVRILGQTTNVKLTKIIHSLQGGKASITVEAEKVDEKDLRKKDMSDFFQGSRSQRDN